MMSRHMLWALILALELLTATLAVQDFEDEGDNIKSLEPFLQVDNDISDDTKVQSKSNWLEKKKGVELDQLNEILDLEHEYLDEEDDVVLWRAVVTSLAEWNYKKMLSKKNGREKRDKEPVCYQNVGCFLNDGPFSHLSHPSSPEEIDTKFYLYTGVKEEPDLISYMNLTSIRTSSFNASHVIKVIIHGFGSSCRRIWAKEMRHALLTVDDPNVICVDWEKGASLPNYPRATSNTRLVGRQVAILVNKIHEIFGTNNSMVHLIGFSLGAHVSGYAGAELRNVSRITGLDPAGPMFANQDIEARLDKTDGAFVDVIHSNGESLIMGGLGAWAPMGHIDFYPNGGRMQKGCTNLFLGAVTDIIFSSTPGDGRSLCNHRRAYKFFTDSVVPKCLFPAFPCENYDKFLAGECFPCSDDKCGNMGYYADKSPGSGIMYLATREEEPFCANQFKVMIYSSYNYPEAVSRGKIEIAFMRDDEYPDVFYMTKGPDEELRSGGKMVRMVVAHPLQDLPTKIRLIYTAYNGWLSSGLAYWSIDKLVITDSFGKNASYCKTGLVLPSGVSTTITLNQGDCIPVFYDVYAPNRDQIWKTADMNNKVVNLYGDVNIIDPKLQLLDPSTGRLLSMNSTHRFSATELNNTAAIYPYGPIDITALQRHIPANIKVSKARKPLIPSLRFISSLQRHFRSKPKGGHPAQQETYYPAGRPIQEIPIDYKEQLPERNQTLELYPLPRPHPQIARPPVRGEQLAPVFGPNQPQYASPYQPLRTANPEYKPPETVYVQAPGESPFQNQGGLQDYFIQEQATNPEKMNGRREVTKHLGQELYLESTSVKYADQYYGPSELQNYAQNYDYATGEDGEPFYEQKDEVADYDSLKTDFTGQGLKNNLEKPSFDQNENVEGGQGYADGLRPVRYELLNTAQSSEKPDHISDLKGALLHQTENTLIYRQSDGSVKMIFMPNQTSEYDDQIVSYTERDDMISDEFEYYDEEYDEVPGAQLLNNDRIDNESETVLVSTSRVDRVASNKNGTSATSKFENEKSSKTESRVVEVKSTEVKSKDALLPVSAELKRGGNMTETRTKLNATEDLTIGSAKIEAKTEPVTKARKTEAKSEETIKVGSDKKLNSTDINTETAYVVSSNKTFTSSESFLVPPKGVNFTEIKPESVSLMSNQKTVNLTEAKSESAAVTSTEKATVSTTIKTEFVSVTTLQKDLTDNRTQLTPLKTEYLATDEQKEQPLSIQLTNNVKRNINVQLNVNRVDLQKSPITTTAEEVQNQKSNLNIVTKGLTSSTGLNTSDPLSQVGPSNQRLDTNSTTPPHGKFLNSKLPPQTVVINTLPLNTSGTNTISSPAKVIIPAIPGDISVQTSQINSTISEPQRNTSSTTKDTQQPLVSEVHSPILENSSVKSTSSPIGAKFDQSERVSGPSRRAKGAALERKDAIKPVTIMASVELTATAPSIVTEIPDNSSLIAQFVNLGQADIRRSKSRSQESSRRENPLLASPDSKKVSGGVRGRDLKTGNNTVNNISDSPGKTGEISDTILPTVQTQNITSARVPTRSTQITAASNNPDASGKNGVVTTTISSAVQIQNITGVKVPTRLPELPVASNVTVNPFESLTTSTEPSRSTSTTSSIPSTSSDRQFSRDAPRNTQKNVTSDSTFKAEAEKKFPEVPITLIKFKAEDRVTERSKKTKDPVLVQHRLPEVIMAVPSEIPLQGTPIVPELPLAHRMPELVAQVPSDVPQQHRVVEAFVTVPLEYRQPEMAVGELPLPQPSQPEETSFNDYPLQRPTSSELSNPFGIPMERLSDRGFNKPPAVSTQFSVPKTGSGVPLSPTATSRRNLAGKRPTLVYNPGEVRPQNAPYDARQSFVPQMVENLQKPDETFPLRVDNAASDDFIPAERVDHSKVRPIEDWPVLPPGVRLSRFDEHQRHLVETAKLQTLSRDLMPPPLEFEEQGSRRRSRFQRYGSWIPNIWSYINPFGPKQDEADPKSSNGWMTYVWGQPGATPQSPPPPITPVVNQPARPVPVRRNFKARNRPRTFETGDTPVEYIAAA